MQQFDHISNEKRKSNRRHRFHFDVAAREEVLLKYNPSNKCQRLVSHVEKVRHQVYHHIIERIEPNQK